MPQPRGGLTRDSTRPDWSIPFIVSLSVMQLSPGGSIPALGASCQVHLKVMVKSSQFFKAVNFDWTRLRVDTDGDMSLDHEFDIDAEEFLKFAELDIEGGDERAFVNALSNSKRAIDCQVDKILYCLSLNTKRQNFPSKIELLKEIGIVAPRILRKVISKRNYLEHEYKS